VTKPEDASHALPRLTIRVGVTGARRFPDGIESSLRAKASAILRFIREQTVARSPLPAAERVYAADGTEPAPALLRMISPLAEGADRLVAEEALKLGFRLYAPFPFSQAEYEKDFGGQLETFRHLADQAQIFEIDGGRDADETASYEAVGRFVVRNSDIIIALWDGAPARGRGGTAEIVQYAARSGTPVWWINLTTGEIKLALSAAQIKHPELALQGARAESAIVDYLAGLVLPSSSPHPEKKGILGHAAHVLSKFAGASASPLAAYLAEGPMPTGGLWRAHRDLLALLAPAPRGKKPETAPPATTSLELWWKTHYLRADALSQAYGDRYRSSYVLIAGLAFLTFAASFAFEAGLGSIVPVCIEFILLLCIAALVLLNHMRGWHERWIAYRLLAELCRNQLILAPLGRSLPGSEVLRSAAEAGVDREIPAAREAWVGWWFLALQRGAPPPEGDAQSAGRRAFALARNLVVEQKEYHRVRRNRAAKADGRLIASGEAFFLLAVVGVALQLALVGKGEPFGGVRALEIVVRLLSAAAAALAALRGYAELALLARQSLRMQKAMEEIEAEFDDLDLEEPLASQRLGATLHRLSILMTQDVRGWAQIFRLKAVETG
jgi:hypothetical protein